jgi:hypothetical protein
MLKLVPSDCPQNECESRGLWPDVASADRATYLREKFDILAPEDLAAMIGVDTRTLAVWRAQKRGPDAVRVGRAIFYRRQDVAAWLAINVLQMDRAA